MIRPRPFLAQGSNELKSHHLYKFILSIFDDGAGRSYHKFLLTHIHCSPKVTGKLVRNIWTLCFKLGVSILLATGPPRRVRTHYLKLLNQLVNVGEQ